MTDKQFPSLEDMRQKADAITARATDIYQEPLACERLYLGPGEHEGDDSRWRVHLRDGDQQVGIIRTHWPDGPQYRVDFVGELWGVLGPYFTVTALDIKTALLHLSIEVGRRKIQMQG